ncbi:MAG TPA: cytochrome c peroxidase, partial [bacterium]|nr:cytochrome c peroxidase [bacterium]
LFYDRRLSGTNTLSCASCHDPDKAFSDGVALTSGGASGRPLLRHTPALQNLAWATGYFWDGGAADLESLAFGPITHPDEMAQDLTGLETELRAVAAYGPLFEAAFPGEGITAVTIARGLAQFQRTLISGNSAYDRWVRREAGAGLTADEQAGLVVVRQKCGTCHAGELFTDMGYHNNGLDTAYSEAHERVAWGRARISSRLEDIGKYKTPTLRNVELTAPYMHDGRFATLEQVLDHYEGHVKESATLDPVLRRPDGGRGIRLTGEERRQIRAFLGALTDTSFTRDPALRP